MRFLDRSKRTLDLALGSAVTRLPAETLGM